MSKRIKTGEDAHKIMVAIAFAIDHREVEDSLNDLGYSVRISETDTNSGDFSFTVEGGENDTAFIATLKLTKIEMGFDTIHVGAGAVTA